MSDFVHLHLHSQYSLLDGAIKVKDLIDQTLKRGMKSVAVTDHGNMFGVVDFYKKAKAAGVKPIIGVEAYISGPKGREDKTDRKAFHTILIAKNREGYDNLKKLISAAYLEGFYYYPRIDKPLLAQHSKGLIALSACLGGEIAQKFAHEGPDSARQAAREYKAIFEPEHFYLEMQYNGYPEQTKLNNFYKQLSKDEGIPLVVTNDSHYMDRKDAKAHEILMCIQTGRTLAENDRLKHVADELYFKTPAEIAATEEFKETPEAIYNSSKIADMVDLDIELGKVFLPNFKVPEGLTREDYLAEVAKRGLEARLKMARYQTDREKYFQRLQYELGVINKMGFAGYFLIVWDFIAYAKKHGIPVGPGRGSGAGSIVAYSLEITDLDPLPYDLLFERFLNPERVSMPDFDIDFCQDRRGEVIDYVINKYGERNVGQIVTFSQLSAKSVIKDVARVMGVSFNEVNEITKLIPSLVDGKKVSINQAMELEPKLRALYDEKPNYKEIIDTSRQLEGLNRGTGIHAAGVVIGDLPLESYVPLSRAVEKVKDPETGKDVEKIFRVTQFAKDEVEQAGLVKFDFLGLKTLTVIDNAVQLVNQRIADENAGKRKASIEHPHLRFTHAPRVGTAVTPLKIEELVFDDMKVFGMLSKGDTDGVFQMESSGFKELLKKLKPDRFEDIIAAGALYRPGPLDAGLVDDYIERKHGRKPISYPHAKLEGILKPTYGVIVYQEQVMLIAVQLSGFTMGQADTLRKAMGKKNADVMAKMRKSFVDGAVELSGMDRQITEDYFALIEKFAGYAFNKSHSAAYAVLTYQTAYLKHYYPVEFMAALLSTEMGSTDNVVKYTQNAREMGISVLAPDVNTSDRGFAAPGEQIRFGLGAIKGVGDNAIAAVKTAREKKAFVDLFDFCERVDTQVINKKVLEALVESGAMDAFKLPRSRLFGAIEKALSSGQSTQKDAKSGQGNLFAMMAPPKPVAGAAFDPARYPQIDEWDTKERLKREKGALGFFLSGHPLDRYKDDLKRLINCSTQDLMAKGMRADVTLAGVVSAMRERPLKDGSGRMAFLTLEDLYGTCEVLVFSKCYADCEMVLKADEPILVKGQVTIEGDEETQIAKLRAEKIVLLANARAERTQRIEMTLPARLIDGPRLDRLKGVLAQNSGQTPTRLTVVLDNGIETAIDLPLALAVNPSEELATQIERIFDGERVVLFA
ncbi:MAG: DNA polymerase III subunit alpha [Deltaproteobacteria bacterium]|nr:DNA polymerase III subunit alpha [Deltaproteobacteria bacterium]